MNSTYLLIGGNMGNRPENLANARLLLQQYCGTIEKTSSVYETAAWGETEQPSFLNQALELKTAMTPQELMKCILDVEKNMGRIRKEKYGPRIIDIDILLFNNEAHHDSFVTIPHPELQNRRFALIPLAEIAEKVKHPILKKSCFELLCDCDDELPVKKFSR